MLISEFVERTGFEPTADEYADIEEDYYSFDGNKDAFCEKFVRDGEDKKIYAARAQRIMQLRDVIVENDKIYKAELAEMKIEIEKLKKALDAELEWKPADNVGTTMSQNDYESLYKSCASHAPGTTDFEPFPDDEKAAEIVGEFFGFIPDKIKVFSQARTYEVNKHRQLRVKETFERRPCYEATDWNYIRFNILGWQYEMVNGNLRPYYS